MRPVIQTKTLTASSVNNICQSQTPAGAGNLVLNGSAVSGGVATLDTQRQILISCAGSDAARTFTITGQDQFGKVISENVAGSSGGTTASVQSFLKVTSISVDAATAGAVQVGTNGVGASAPVVLDQFPDPHSVSLFVELVSGSVNYTVQYTSDDPWVTTFNDVNAKWTNHPNLTAQAAHGDGNIAFPASAVRVVINSGTGQIRFTVRQAGIRP